MKRNSGYSIRIALLVTCLCLLSASALGAKFGEISDDEWQATAPADYPEATALILFDEGHMNVTTKMIEFKRHVRIKILTTDGIDEVGERWVWYNDELDRLKGFKAHTITPDGKKHKVKKDAVFVRSSGDYRQKVFTFPQLTAGCIIEYRYDVYSDNFWYLDPWYFQNRIYTLKSVFSVSLANGFTYNVSYHNLPYQFREPVTEETRDVDRGGDYKIRTFTWTRIDLPPITDEPYMAAEENYRSALKFQLLKYEDPYNHIVFVDDWKSLGENYHERLDNYNNKRKDIGKLAEELTAGLTSPIEKSRALYRYVTQNFATSDDYKYKFFVNEKVSEMLEKKQGSEEERNLLLTLLHQEAGIEAWPLLIGTRSYGLINPRNPTLRQFNHILSYIQFENSYVLLDARYKKAPWGLLPPDCLVEMGFLMDRKNYPVIKIEPVATPSIRADITKMVVDENGVVACSSQCRFSGYWATSYGRRYDRKEPEEFAQQYFIDRLPAECTLGGHDCTLDTTNEFVAEIDFTSEELVTRLDENYLIKPVSYAYRSNPFKSEKRFFPVDFMYPFTYHNIVEIIMADTSVEYQPLAFLNLTISGASFVRQTDITDSSVIVGTRLVIDRPLFKPEEYRKLREFFDKVAQSSEDEVAAVLAGNEN